MSLSNKCEGMRCKKKDYKSKFPRVTSREQFKLIDYDRD